MAKTSQTHTLTAACGALCGAGPPVGLGEQHHVCIQGCRWHSQVLRRFRARRLGPGTPLRGCSLPDQRHHGARGAAGMPGGLLGCSNCCHVHSISRHASDAAARLALRCMWPGSQVPAAPPLCSARCRPPAIMCGHGRTASCAPTRMMSCCPSAVTARTNGGHRALL